MQVFLSWSKERSKQVAELLNDWIPCVIQSIEPWISSQDIEDGELWFNAVQNQVSNVINGIICLTKENREEPWILFEAGGLAKGLEKSRVFVLLIDLSSDDILLSPLSAFNQTTVDESGIRRLMHVINNRTTKPISLNIINQAFDKFWPDFKQRFDEILSNTETAKPPINKNKTDLQVDLLQELLRSVRNLEKGSTNIPTSDSNSPLPKNFPPPRNYRKSQIISYMIKSGIPFSEGPEYQSVIDEYLRSEAGIRLSSTYLKSLLKEISTD